MVAAKVKTRGNDRSDPADWGGVNVKESAAGLSSPLGKMLMGVWSPMAELGVSGYAMENGPGV